MSIKAATPAKLRDGSWGARVKGDAKKGDEIQITTQGGKSWTAVVETVVWSGDGITLVKTAKKEEPLSVDGRPAIIGRHWSQKGHGPTTRLCAGGCGRRVSGKYAECFSCHQESIEAM